MAEKFETMVSRGLTNSRLRDYYDLWLLPTLRSYDGSELAAALAATFRHCGAALPTEVPPGLSDAYFGTSAAQAGWRSFLTNRVIEAPSELSDVCEAIIAFMMPPTAAVAAGQWFERTWKPSRGWS
jgi:hypothetical protein